MCTFWSRFALTGEFGAWVQGSAYKSASCYSGVGVKSRASPRVFFRGFAFSCIMSGALIIKRGFWDISLYYTHSKEPQHSTYWYSFRLRLLGSLIVGYGFPYGTQATPRELSQSCLGLALRDQSSVEVDVTGASSGFVSY